MKEHTYRNKAFISYRHAEKDSRMAALLQRELERYRLPRGLEEREKKAEASGRNPGAERAPRRLGRIFRDSTDLGARADLTAELRRELEDSEYMIVLCSPASAESVWVEREIRYFLQTHTADRILPVLVDGEPEQVLPALFDRFGKMPQHPLACDFRDKTGAEDAEGNRQIPGSLRRILFRSGYRDRVSGAELTRLAAALLDCPYDELAGRRKRYETRRRAAVLGTAFLLLAGVAVYYAATSARVRQSYRDQLLAESESLAVQSETALAGRQRFDAIRYALEALPEKEGDRPVAGQAVLALQRAAAAYVPEGSRRTAQVAELQAPGRINAYEVCQGEEETYACAAYGSGDVILWNADTGNVLFDSGDSPEENNRAGAAPAKGDAADAGLPEEWENYELTVYDVSLHLTQDLLVFAKGPMLAAVETRTGKLLWQAEEGENIALTVFDENAGAIALAARGFRYNTEPGPMQEDAENGTPTQEAVLELQLRSTADGSLLYSRKAGTDPEALYSVFFEKVSFTGSGRRMLVLRRKDTRSSLVLLDPDKGTEKVLLEENCISGYCLTEDRQILAVSGQTYRSNIKGFTFGSADSKEIRYSQEEADPFTISCIDLQSEKEKWRTLTSCTQNYNICLSSDLEIEAAGGRKICLAAAGSHIELLAQDTGKCLYRYDLPGLPVSWRIGEGRTIAGETREAVVSALQDGSQVCCFFDGGEVFKNEGVFPGEVLTAEEAGGRLYFLCGQEGGTSSGDRILVFGEDVSDPEAICLTDAAGRPFRVEESWLRYGEKNSNSTVLGGLLPADDMFILIHRKEEGEGENKEAAEETPEKPESEAIVNGGGESENGGGENENRGGESIKSGNVIVTAVDARTGINRWETELGANLFYAGYAEKAGMLVFRDAVLSGWEKYLRSARGEKNPEPTWVFLHVEDGHVDTAAEIEKKALPGNPESSSTIKAGGESLFLYAAPAEGREAWLLNYSLSGGETDKIRVPGEYQEQVRAAYFPSQISSSPDGSLAVYAFGISGDTEEGAEEEIVVNLLVDWKKHRVRDLEETPWIEAASVVTWSGDGQKIAFMSHAGQATLVSANGEVLYESSEASADSGFIRGVGFLRNDLFLVEETGCSVHFQVPERGIDFLLPAGRQVQYDQSLIYANEYCSWELPDHKILLQYGTQSFIFEPATGIVEAVIDSVAAYNPQTDTFLLYDENEHFAIFPRYGWQDLADKGRKILGEDLTGK